MASCRRKVIGCDNPESPMTLAKLEDLTLDGEHVAIEDIATFMGKQGHEYSVLNVDFEKELMILVRTGGGVNLKTAPFVYRAQRRHALEVLCIPFADLDKVEPVIAPRVSSVTNVFLHNTGRCGSTLLCKALENLSTIQGISEPSLLTSIGAVGRIRTDKNTVIESLNNAVKMSYTELVKITRIGIMLLNNFFISRAPSKTTICYKTTAETIFGAEILQDAIPSSKTIYLYRSCYAVNESIARIFTHNSYFLYWLITTLRLDTFLLQRLKTPEIDFKGSWSSKYHKVPFPRDFIWNFTHYWWMTVEKAVSLTKRDPSRFFHAILHYEDLRKQKESLVLKVALRLGLLPEGDRSRELAAVTKAFKANSQSGVALESKRRVDDVGDVWFGEWERACIDKVLQHLGEDVTDGDFRLHGTL
ncbi:uncharacterized protein LOC116612374 [Nematostella vectensis]|uniref:uncharacterized protein LOC116612374 n=1 Tax=Nematostella vectensis TaxID=45351 RepID=UPI0020770B5A|nr:uncharacterized protein LOC116612374 [Nematostella vectensis]